MKHLLLVYHSQHGHTEAMMRAVCDGIRAAGDGIELRCKRALEAGLDDLLWANGLLLGTPENFGYMSGALKDFLDRTYYPAEGKTNGLPYAVFISAGNDGSGAVRALERIATGYGWSRIAEALICQGELDDAALARCRELGEGMAAGLASGIF